MRNAPIVRLNNAIIRGETAIYQSTSDFKNGMTIEIDGAPFKLMEFLHVKPGKGSAFVRTKIKNLNNGSVQEKTFRAGESITAAQVDKVLYFALEYTCFATKSPSTALIRSNYICIYI